jgi:prepilin-type processing-associated H-X9-DG protein
MEAKVVTAATCAAWPAGSESSRTESARAFTVTELLITVACLALLALILLPALARSKAQSSRIYCTSYMKQIGLSFRCWAIDNNDRLPMQVSVTNGGTMELAASGLAFPHFQVMSNELSTPKILFCPNDKNRIWATNFTSDLTDKKLSYFVNIDSVLGDGSSLLSGDRNITNRLSAGSRLVNLTKGSTIAWTKELHSEQGNLGFGDGSVQGLGNRRVSTVLQIPDGVTNRLAVP